MSTWIADAKWKPGAVAFTSAEYSFVTETEVDYIRAVIVGDRLSQTGCKLLSCIPKETRVGRGAFFTTEVEIHNQRGELVARMRQQLYCYNPHPKAAE
jgi:acyl-CoA thioesterase FadM